MRTVILLVSALGLGPSPSIEESHRRNDVYGVLLNEGLTVGQRKVSFEAPRLRDGASSAEEREALREIAGSERAVAEFLRDSVSAPFVLKVNDITDDGQGPIRRASLWFAVHADLDALEKDAEARNGSDDKPVEAGNMKFTARRLEPADLASRAIAGPGSERDHRVWYLHVSGRLLDRLAVEATDRVVATRSPASRVVASMTDRRFDGDAKFPNQWSPIVSKGGRDESGPPKGFAGGASYMKISTLTAEPGVLLVESHFAFAEPRPWFDGAPILRSKFSAIAQDQIRRLRRGVAERRKTAPVERGSP